MMSGVNSSATVRSYSVLTAINEINREAWADFVRGHPNGTAFQMPEMYDVIEASERMSPRILCAVDSNGKICGVLLASVQNFLPGMLARFASRAVISGGPLVGANDRDAILAALLSAYRVELGNAVVFSEMRNLWDMSDCHSTLTSEGWKFEDHLDVLMDLTLDYQTRWKALKHFRQKNIKRVAREGVEFREIKDDENIKLAHGYIRDVYRRIQLPAPDERFLSAVAKHLRNAGLARYFGAFLDGKLIAVRLVLTMGTWIYDYYAGADPSSDSPAAAVLPWEVCSWGAKEGFRVFDFGGAGKPNVPYGVRDYKLAFGGELVNFGRYNFVHRSKTYALLTAGIDLKKRVARQTKRSQ